MSPTKRENLLKKAETTERKISELQTELEKHRRELTELDKEKLYQSVTKTGLTVDKAVEVLSDFSVKTNAVTTTPNEEPGGNPVLSSNEIKNKEKNDEKNN